MHIIHDPSECNTEDNKAEKPPTHLKVVDEKHERLGCREYADKAQQRAVEARSEVRQGNCGQGLSACTQE